MTPDLNQLRIDKSERASADDRARWPFWFVLLLIVGALTYFVWSGTRTRAVAVEVMRVRAAERAVNETDVVALNATGYIVASHKIELASKAIGRVAWVGVEMGDRIKQGDVLVRLEDDEYKARVAQQQGQLDNAKARLAELQAGSRPQEIAQAAATLAKSTAEFDGSQTNLKRLTDLRESRAVSGQQIDDALALVAARAAQVDADKQLLELAKVGPRKEQIDAQAGTVRQLEGGLALAMVDLDNTVIRSPLNATILARNVEQGEFVTTGFVGENGAKGYVVSLADLNDLRVDLDVSQNDFSKVRPRQPCWIVTDAYPDRRYDGYVDLISPEANRSKATVQVRVKVSAPDELLRPDMNATVSFLAMDKLATTRAASRPTTTAAAIKVPTSAVRDGAIFVVEAGKAARRTITAGATADGAIEVRKGLIGGEVLIVAPPAELKDGDDVRISEGAK